MSIWRCPWLASRSVRFPIPCSKKSTRIIHATEVFYSFHYQRDSWRASKKRNIGGVEGNRQQAIKNGRSEARRETAIKRWIDDQLQGRTCTIVLVGAETANRPGFDMRLSSHGTAEGLLGIRVHKLLDHNQQPSVQGQSVRLIYLERGRKLSVVRVYDPREAPVARLYLHQRQPVELDRSSDRRSLEVRTSRQNNDPVLIVAHRVPRLRLELCLSSVARVPHANYRYRIRDAMGRSGGIIAEATMREGFRKTMSCWSKFFAGASFVRVVLALVMDLQIHADEGKNSREDASINVF